MTRCIAIWTVLLGLLGAAAPAAAQWKPEKPIEIIAPSGPGGTTDRTARVLARILTQHQLVDVPVNVVNKAGGSGTLGLTYLNTRPGDAHYIIIGTSASISNYVMGVIPYNYTDFTQLAMLFDEYLAVATRADSSIKSGADLVSRLKASPESVSFGISTSIGGGNHTTLMTCLRAAGIDLKRLKTAIFPGGAATTLALLGGHVDVINTGPGNMVDHFKSGKVRGLAISAPQRIWGVYSTVPTWREQGVPADSSSWRGLLGPKGLTPAQVAWWDKTIAALVKTEDWKKDLENNFWVEGYTDARGARKRYDQEYEEFKAIWAELGVARPSQKPQ